MKTNRITGTLHEDQYTFVIISRSFHLTVRNISGKIIRENQNPNFVFSNFFFCFPKIVRSEDSVTRFRTATQATDDNIIQRMRIACPGN